MSVSKGNGYAELYDFENNKIYQRSTNTLIEYPMDSIRGTSCNFKFDNIYYSLFGYSYSTNKQYFVYKFKFTSIDISKNTPSYLYYYNNNVIGKKISCYISGSSYFVCFYIYKNTDDLKTYGYIKILNENFKQIGGMDIGYVYNKETTFLKCIHYKADIGIFIYYYFINENNNQITPQIPKILFKSYACTIQYDFSCTIYDYSQNFKEIELNRRVFNIHVLFNDLIKISDNKICFISTSDNKDVLYIVTLNIFTTVKVIIRYYDIELFNKCNYKLFMELKGHLFNNFISLAFSFCPQEICTENTEEYYSGFMIFSYPNGTDFNMNITDYLLRNNDVKIDNLIIDL